MRNSFFGGNLLRRAPTWPLSSESMKLLVPRWRRAISGGGEGSQVEERDLRWRREISGGGERPAQRIAVTDGVCGRRASLPRSATNRVHITCGYYVTHHNMKSCPTFPVETLKGRRRRCVGWISPLKRGEGWVGGFGGGGGRVLGTGSPFERVSARLRAESRFVWGRVNMRFQCSLCNYLLSTTDNQIDSREH